MREAGHRRWTISARVFIVGWESYLSQPKENNGMNLEDRIGVSLISFAGITTEQAIRAASEGGFKTIEVFVSTATHCSIGYPTLLAPSAGVWPRDCDGKTRGRLRKQLSEFSIVTVHAQIEGINIASWNRSIREESVQQYLECIDFAHDIGASVCTFHPHSSCRYPHYARQYEEETRAFNLEFARRALERARPYDLTLGFEGPDGAGAPVTDLVLGMNENRFGVLFDPAQSCQSGMTREELIRDIYRCRGRIPEVHVHGSLSRTVGRIGHLPLRMNNTVDWRRVMAALNDIEYQGPFLFEITSSEDYRQVIRDCQESKDLLIEYADHPPASGEASGAPE